MVEQIESVACPNCQQKFRIPTEKIGRIFKCTKCAKPFVAVIGEKPPVAPERPPLSKPYSVSPAGDLDREAAGYGAMPITDPADEPKKSRAGLIVLILIVIILAGAAAAYYKLPQLQHLIGR